MHENHDGPASLWTEGKVCLPPLISAKETDNLYILVGLWMINAFIITEQAICKFSNQILTKFTFKVFVFLLQLYRVE